MNINTWIHEVAERLRAEFGSRLQFVGLQGSRGRGEAREDSDIDVVVLLDSVSANDLAAYRAIVQAMPDSELACGFIGSAEVLAALLEALHGRGYERVSLSVQKENFAHRMYRKSGFSVVGGTDEIFIMVCDLTA